MAIRYSAEFLLHLRDSPLCVKPPALRPPEDWMGAPPDQIRGQVKTLGDRPRTDNPLLDQSNRRPGIDRHVSRSSANAEDIVFAPPRMAFASARGNKAFDNDGGLRDSDSQGRFSLRGRNGEERNSNPLRRRAEGDQDTEGWSTVKPRKSFGHEGAERFHGRMGGSFRDDKRTTRERDERDAPRDRLIRNSSEISGREREGDEVEGRPRPVSGRSKLDIWLRNDAPESPLPEKRDRGDRNKSWRERDREAESLDDRSGARTQDRRWGRDRDQRVEREPEWLDDPTEAQREAHTQQDFQKWMEQMKKSKTDTASSTQAAAKEAAEAAAVAAAAIVAERQAVQSAPAPAVEPGPDKFFMAFGASSALDPTTPIEQREAPAKARPSAKPSRFTSFFSQPQAPEETRTRTEPPTPMTGPAPNGGLAAMLQAPPVEEERQAFQQLLAKLQKQTISATTPPAPSPFQAPVLSQGGDGGRRSAITSPESFAQYGGNESREGPVGRPPPQNVHEILAPRPQMQNPRPDQLLQDLVGHHQRTSSQDSARADHGVARNNNSNTEFLMNLMRAGTEHQRPDQHQQQNVLRMPLGQSQAQPQSQKQIPGLLHMPMLAERELEFGRDARGQAQRQMRNQPPPGFPMMEESFHGVEHESNSRPSQPTQILQRPPPPGLEQMPPSWMQQGGQMPPPQQQQRGPMMPPPGLVGGPGRNANVPPPHMFPPNFPGSMPPPPPDVMGGLPPRNMPPPPPGFFNGPPHGFIPPGLAGFNGPPGPGMDSHAFAGGPFEGRGLPPTPNSGRGTGYGRL
ncbi:hypothetical protein S40288_00353 [Stachybotrys chartarum IBT 40288]|nr:hypothetical protein S40288_00353 [Stachybotrys chartarum IBT 40288]